MKSPEQQQLSTLCEAQLQDLTAADIAALTGFARHRLLVHRISPSYGEDVTQRALQRVLQGLEGDQGGRRPRLLDLESKPAFQNYLRGVISSVAEAMSRNAWFRVECLPEEEVEDDLDAVRASDSSNTPGCFHDGGAAAKNLEYRDLRDELFVRLRARAPQRLMPAIEAWESVFTQSDRIPAHSRKHAWEIRKLAQKVLPGIGGLE